MYTYSYYATFHNRYSEVLLIRKRRYFARIILKLFWSSTCKISKNHEARKKYVILRGHSIITFALRRGVPIKIRKYAKRGKGELCQCKGSHNVLLIDHLAFNLPTIITRVLKFEKEFLFLVKQQVCSSQH